MHTELSLTQTKTNTPSQFRAYLSTAQFDFEAYGLTPEEANATLVSGLETHAKQVGLAPDWHAMHDRGCYAIQNGCAYRDRESLPQPDSMATPPYLQAFPDFGDMDVEPPSGFEDTSYRHDTSPSFTRYLFNGQFLRLFVDYKDLTERENAETARFSVLLYDQNETFLQTLVASDDFSEVEEAIDGFEPGMTPFQFIRDVSRMTRDQVNDLYQEKVGYRPDVEGSFKEDVLVLDTAEITFYHAGGEETDWPKHEAVAMLGYIRANDQHIGLASRCFGIRSEGWPALVVHTNAPFNQFLRMDDLTASDRFDIETMPVNVSLYLEKGEGTYIITRLK